MFRILTFCFSTTQPERQQNVIWKHQSNVEMYIVRGMVIERMVNESSARCLISHHQQTVDHIKTRMYQPLLSCVSSRDGGASPSQIGTWLLLRLLNAVRSQFSQLFFHGLHWKGTINNLHKHKSWVRFADSFDNRFHKHKIYLGSFYITHIKLAILAFRNRSQEVEENIACHSGPLSSWVDTQN